MNTSDIGNSKLKLYFIVQACLHGLVEIDFVYFASYTLLRDSLVMWDEINYYLICLKLMIFLKFCPIIIPRLFLSWVRLQTFKLTNTSSQTRDIGHSSYKYLYHAGLKPTLRSTANDCSVTAPTVPSNEDDFIKQILASSTEFDGFSSVCLEPFLCFFFRV